MQVKVESEKVGLKLNIQKTKIMVSSHNSTDQEFVLLIFYSQYYLFNKLSI